MKGFEKYKEYFTKEYLMGPNSLRIADEVLEKYPLHMHQGDTILELGCGTGLSSLFIANETNALVHAIDLWVPEEENMERFTDWGMEERIIPFCIDASVTEFEKQKYAAVLSIDAYHYFAGKDGFFVDRILPAIKNNGIALIAVPGVKEAFEGKQDEIIKEWIGEETYMFHGCNWWKNIIGVHQDIDYIDVWEMECFEDAWMDWIESGNEHSFGDKEYYDTIIKKFTCLVGIAVKKK